MKKIKKIVFLVFCVASPLLSLSQNYFERQFGQISFGQRNAGIVDNSEILLVGSEFTFTTTKGVFIKTDDLGTLLSVTLATGANVNLWGQIGLAKFVYYPSQTEIISCIYDKNLNDSILQVNIFKMNNQLDTIWSYCYLDTTFTATAVQYLLAGQLKYLLVEKNSTLNTGGGEIKVIELDTAGNVNWTKSFPVTVIPPFNIYSVHSSIDGGYYGLARDTVFHYFKTDSFFNVSWCRKMTIPFTSNNYYFPILFSTSSGKLFSVSGIGDTTFLSGSSTYKGLLICELDTSSGTVLWAKEIRADFPMTPHIVYETSDGNLLIGGDYSYGDPYFQFTSYHGFLLKTDVQGNVIWGDSIYNVSWRDRVIGLQERDNKLLISFDRYDQNNPRPFFIVTDTAALTGCMLHRTPFYNFGNVAGIQNMPHPSFSPQPDTISRIIPVLNLTNGFAYPTYYCNTLGTEEHSFSEDINIYPNPFSSEVSITLQKQNIKQVIIAIKNILGQTVFSNEVKAPKKESRLDLNFLENGIYLLDVIIDGERTVKKFVKE